MSTADSLRKAVIEKRLQDIVKCYSAGIPGDQIDEDGNNLLHLAAKGNNASIVKAVLVLYERRYRLAVRRNRDGKLPRDLTFSPEIHSAITFFYSHRPEAKKDPDGVLELEGGINKKNIINQRFEKDHGERKRDILLSLDGGGIRGLVLVQMLMFLDDYLTEKYPKQKISIWKRFDWVAGTSTGGILALTLGRGKSLEDCRMLYLKLKDEIFVGKKPYDTSRLETYLKDVLSSREKLSSIKLIIPTCLANVAPPVLKLFRNFSPPIEECESFGYEDPDNVYIWKAARCSSAAPLFFAPVEDKYVDGGLMANNPVLELMTEHVRFENICHRLLKKQTPPIGCVISLGTGENPQQSIGRGKYHQMLKAVSKRGAEVRAMLQVGLRQLTEADGLPIDRAQAWCWSMNVPFFRFSPPLQPQVSLDENQDAALMEMLWSTEVYMRNEIATVNQLLDLFNILYLD